MSDGRPLEAGDVAALLANPIYAFRIHPSLGRPHEHLLSEADWITANERAVTELGSRRWLDLLVEALDRDHRDRHASDDPFAIADPYPAITVDPALCEEYPPIVEPDMWIRANQRGLDEDVGAWLRNFVSVLNGAYA